MGRRGGGPAARLRGDDARTEGGSGEGRAGEAEGGGEEEGRTGGGEGNG